MLQKERLSNNYDFLRVFAALCITFTHSYNLLKQSGNEPLMYLTGRRIDFSFIGLSIFFSVSGYLIAKSAVTSVSFKNYLWKRFLRIQPLLIIVCLLSIFLVGPLFTSLSSSSYFHSSETYSYLRNIMPVFGLQFYLPGVFAGNAGEHGVNGSLWTLVIEERLYLFLSVFLIFRNVSRPLFLGVVSILNVLFIAHTYLFQDRLLFYFNQPQFFYALIFLNASCFYLLNIHFEKLLEFPSAVFVVFSIILISFFADHAAPLHVILIPLFVICVAHGKGITNAAGRYGDLTYGIYIFSFPVQQMLIARLVVGNNPLFLFFFTTVIVIPAAFISWHLLEKKMGLLKNRVV